jgi:hypothetical protein
MYIGDLDIYPIIILSVLIYFLFILYRLYHWFRFILESDFTPCMIRCSNSYRKYFSILYREGSTIQTSMTVEFSPFVFDIYRRNKKQSLRWTGNVWMPRKMLSHMLERQGWKKENTLGQKRKKNKVDKKDDITIILFFFSIFLIILFGLPL